jgi:hypothetical protein
MISLRISTVYNEKRFLQGKAIAIKRLAASPHVMESTRQRLLRLAMLL